MTKLQDFEEKVVYDYATGEEAMFSHQTEFHKGDYPYEDFANMADDEFLYGACVPDNEAYDTMVAHAEYEIYNRAEMYGYTGEVGLPSKRTINYIGCDIGDDTADITDCLNMALVSPYIINNILLLWMSEVDTWTNDRVIMLSEDTFPIPRGPSEGWMYSVKYKNTMELMGYKDPVKIRLITKVRKEANIYASTPDGKCSTLSRQYSNSDPVARVFLGNALLMQDICLDTTRMDRPKYVPSFLGGSSAAIPFETKDDLYNYLKEYKGNTRHRYFEALFREAIGRYENFRMGNTLTEPILLGQASRATQYDGWIYADAAYSLKADSDLPESISQPFPIGAMLHRDSSDLHLSGIYSRLWRAGKVYSLADVIARMNSARTAHRLLSSTMTCEMSGKVIAAEESRRRKEKMSALLGDIPDKLVKEIASREDRDTLEGLVKVGAVQRFDDIELTLLKSTCSILTKYIKDHDFPMSHCMQLRTYYDAEKVDSQLFQMNFGVPDIEISGSRNENSKWGTATSKTRSTDIKDIRGHKWADRTIELVRAKRRPTTDNVVADHEIRMRVEKAYENKKKVIVIMTDDRRLIEEITSDKPGLTIVNIPSWMYTLMCRYEVSATRLPVDISPQRFMNLCQKIISIPIDDYIIDTGARDMVLYTKHIGVHDVLPLKWDETIPPIRTEVFIPAKYDKVFGNYRELPPQYFIRSQFTNARPSAFKRQKANISKSTR